MNTLCRHNNNKICHAVKKFVVASKIYHYVKNIVITSRLHHDVQKTS